MRNEPQTYASYDKYLHMIASNDTFMGQPEIIASALLYEKNINITFSGSC